MTENQDPLNQAHIAIAVLETKVEAQAREIERLTLIVERVANKLDAVANTLSEARGGWKFMMALGGAGATFGAGLMWVVHAIANGRGGPQ